MCINYICHGRKKGTNNEVFDFKEKEEGTSYNRSKIKRSRRVDEYAISKSKLENGMVSKKIEFVSEDDFFCEINGVVCDLRKGVFLANSTDGGQATAFYVKMKNKNFIITGSKLKGSKTISSFFGVDGNPIEISKKGFVTHGKDVIIIPTLSLQENAVVFDMAGKLNEFVEIK